MEQEVRSLEIDPAILAQPIYTLLAHVRTLQTLVREESGITLDLPTLRQGLREVESIISTLLATVQAASGELLLAALPHSSLSEALAQLVEATAETHTLSSRSVISGQEQALSEQHARLLYRLAQEALTRVALHEGARRLRFHLDYQSAEIVMSIEDDGVPGNVELLFEQNPGETLILPPFLAAEQITNEMMLANIVLYRLRDMLEQMGGTLSITSSVEQGTQIQIRQPYLSLERDNEHGRIHQAEQQQTDELSTKLRVLLVASQTVSRAGLHRLLENYPDVEIVGEAADRMQAISETAELLPQVVLIDVQWSDEQMLELLHQLRQLHTDIHVLLLMDEEREELFYEALREGASGYVLKNVAPDELAYAIRQAARGEVLVQPQMATRLLTRVGQHERTLQENLTARERDVLHLLARGLRNKEIAARLTVSERTVNFHLANIYAKLQVSGRTEALSKALERGLLKV